MGKDKGKIKKDAKDAGSKKLKKNEKAEKKELKKGKDRKEKKGKVSKVKEVKDAIVGDKGTSVLLVEQAEGLYLARFEGVDLLAMKTPGFEALAASVENFRAVCKIEAIHNFVSAAEALEVSTGISAGTVTKTLKKFLKSNAKKDVIRVIDKELARNLKEEGFKVDASSSNLELHRGVRMHLTKLVKGLEKPRLIQCQVGLGHSISRKKMCDDPNRQDKPVTNSIALLDTLDKTVNLFAMRVREWYSWHFPELSKVVTDHETYAKLMTLIGSKEEFLARHKESPEIVLAELTAVCEGNEEIAEEIITAAMNSMGQTVTNTDMIVEQGLASRVDQLYTTRKDLHEYMGRKLDVVAPNLKSVVGDMLAAKLIAHSGSVTNLAKAPASTIQILGAEKALFRALKTRGKTPKYGLLFSSSAISRAQGKNKGRISRFVANKCAIACRLDAFSDDRSNSRGLKLANEVEERLTQLATQVCT